MHLLTYILLKFASKQGLTYLHKNSQSDVASNLCPFISFSVGLIYLGDLVTRHSFKRPHASNTGQFLQSINHGMFSNRYQIFA